MTATQTAVTANIAKWVRATRATRGITGAELARKMTACGVNWTRTSVVKLELGHRATVTADELVALAACLGVLPEALLRTDCANCQGKPHQGYTCNTCGRSR